MLAGEQADAFARAWLEAWNRRDLEAVLAHYAEDVVFTSPRVVSLMGFPDGAVRGKAELRRYFGAGLAAAPDLRFEVRQVLVGVGSVAIVYRNHRGQDVVEVMELDAQGLVRRGAVHYR